MWWIVWIVLMVAVPCIEGLHVMRELRSPIEDTADAGAQPLGYDR